MRKYIHFFYCLLMNLHGKLYTFYVSHIVTLHNGLVLITGTSFYFNIASFEKYLLTLWLQLECYYLFNPYSFIKEGSVFPIAVIFLFYQFSLLNYMPLKLCSDLEMLPPLYINMRPEKSLKSNEGPQ